jgi:hypothetical protein
MNSLKVEIQNVLAMAAALEREPVKPGENEVADRMERRYQISSALIAHRGVRARLQWRAR